MLFRSQPRATKDVLQAVLRNPLAIIILIAVGSILLGIIGALVAVPIGSAIYGVMKFLTGRDPEHPLPYADETPPSPPPAAPAPAA